MGIDLKLDLVVVKGGHLKGFASLDSVPGRRGISRLALSLGRHKVARCDVHGAVVRVDEGGALVRGRVEDGHAFQHLESLYGSLDQCAVQDDEHVDHLGLARDK